MVDKEIFEQKKLLRKEMAARRAEMSKADCEKFSREVVQKILAHPVYKNAKSVMAYAAMPEEIQLNELFDDAFNAGKKLSIPFIVGRGNMRPVHLPSRDVLEVGDFGILTVRQENRKFVDVKEIDCIIIPGAAFDLKGNRLGKGGGYYDRFLKLAFNAKKIAPAFDFQLVENVPITPADCGVNVIITPSKVVDLIS